MEQVPSGQLVLNGLGEDIAPYLCKRSSPESSDFDGLPLKPGASPARDWRDEAQARRGEGFVCDLLFPGSLPVSQRPRASQCATRRTIKPTSMSLLRTKEMSCTLLQYNAVCLMF